MFTKDQLSVIRDRLNALLAQLTEIESQGADSRSTVTLDQARVGRLSRMDALQVRPCPRKRNVDASCRCVMFDVHSSDWIQTVTVSVRNVVKK